MPVPSVTDSLAASVRAAAPRHRAAALLEALSGGDDPPLTAVLVGPSGSGKSTLFNAVVGEALADTGALRPTTTSARRWRSGDGTVLLVDCPPSDQMPEAGLAPLAGADLAVVVTSQSRYADAATWSAVRAARDGGVPLVFAVTRLDRGVAEAIVDDLAERADGAPIVPVEEGAAARAGETLSRLLGAAATRLGELRAARRHELVGAATAAVRSLALDLRIDGERAALLADAVAEAEAAPGDGWGLTAMTDWPDFVAGAAETIRSRGASRLAALYALWDSIDLAPPHLDEELLRAGDAEALSAWREATERRFVAAIRPGWLRRWVDDAVADESWRLAADPERPRRGVVRLWVRGGAADPRIESARALDDLAADRMQRRITPFRDAIPAPAPADPDRLEALAGKLGDEHPPATMPDLTATAVG